MMRRRVGWQESWRLSRRDSLTQEDWDKRTNKIGEAYMRWGRQLPAAIWTWVFGVAVPRSGPNGKA